MKKSVLSIFFFLMVCYCFADTIPDDILSSGALSRDSLVNFLLKNNHKIDRNRSLYNFSSVQEGIRAHIQHLKGYASREKLNNDYANKIKDILSRMYR